jgi:hypothetical protein
VCVVCLLGVVDAGSQVLVTLMKLSSNLKPNVSGNTHRVCKDAAQQVYFRQAQTDQEGRTMLVGVPAGATASARANGTAVHSSRSAGQIRPRGVAPMSHLTVEFEPAQKKIKLMLSSSELLPN